MKLNDHPLFPLQLSFVRDWATWKQLWTAAERIARLQPSERPRESAEATIFSTLVGTVEFWQAMLHWGFHVWADNPTDKTARLIHYLRIADGFDEMWPSPDRTVRTGIGEVKGICFQQTLARKAFEEVCRRVFKNEDGSSCRPHGGWPTWANLMRQPEALDAALHFFRLDDEFRPVNRLFTREDHHARTAAQFGRDLVAFALNFKHVSDSPTDEDRDTVEMFDKRHARFVDILYGLGALGDLPIRENAHYDCAPCEARLTEIALGEKWWFAAETEHRRKPATLEEAIFVGSLPAQMVLNMRILQHEARRQEQRAELMKQARLVEQRLKRLSASAER